MSEPTIPVPPKLEIGGTPRTDAAAYDTGLRAWDDSDPDQVVQADFARQLERELAEAKRALSAAEATVRVSDARDAVAYSLSASAAQEEAAFDERQVEIQAKSADRYGDREVVPVALARTIAHELTLALQGRHPAQVRLSASAAPWPLDTLVGVALDDLFKAYGFDFPRTHSDLRRCFATIEKHLTQRTESALTQGDKNV